MLSLDMSQLLWGILFSAIGFVYFFYGKRMRAIVPLLCGLVLMVYPYFVSNTLVLVLIGTVLSVLPYFVSI